MRISISVSGRAARGSVFRSTVCTPDGLYCIRIGTLKTKKLSTKPRFEDQADNAKYCSA